MITMDRILYWHNRVDNLRILQKQLQLPTVDMILDEYDLKDLGKAFDIAIKALEQEPSGDLISLEVVIEWLKAKDIIKLSSQEETARRELKDLPSVKQERIGHCKDCKYFEYDSVAKVDGVPLIVAHEICNKWGDGCKTKEDGYCFLFEPQERSDKE